MKKLISLSVLPMLLVMGLFILNSCSEKEAAEESIDLPVYTGDNFDEAAVMNEVFTSENSDLKCAGTPNICGEVKFYPLIASQYYYVGALMVYNDEDNLYVTYWSFWGLTDFHLYIGSEEDFPTTNAGNPKFGHFPYKDEESVTGFKTFIIPLSEIPDCYIMVAHAVLGRHTVLAYGENEFSGSRWGWTIGDCVEVCEEEAYDHFFMKLMYYNEDNTKLLWALVEAADPYYSAENDWCNNIGVNQLHQEQTLNLLKYGDGPAEGTIHIVIEDGEIKCSVNLFNPDYTLSQANVFYGTLEDLDTYGVCPSLYLFPYIFEGEEISEFTIPLN